ncbi:MAG: ACP S-malonyltransferase [Candidatus Promineifilaceae bacterium]|nr:ACP S-malonyltransferase [Candidatus Promineifilaceae bacterium]
MSVAYLFPGQGSQQVGMGRELYENEPAARALFDRADAQLGFSLSALCFEGPEAALTDTINQQPALFVTSLATLAAMQVRGEPAPDSMAGHSLGELTALTAAGSMSFADGLALVRRRGELMKAAGQREPGAMAAVLALDVNQVTALCAQASEETGRPVQVANDNCPGQVVISGDTDALEAAVRMAQAVGARKVVRLPITIAAHSPLMATAAAEFGAAVAATPLVAPQIPVIGNVSARPLDTPELIRSELRDQLTAPVRWTESMTYLRDQGIERFVEVGPGEVLLGLMKRIDRRAERVKWTLPERESA